MMVYGMVYDVSRRGSPVAATPLRVDGALEGIVENLVALLHHIRSVGEAALHPLALLYAGLASAAQC